MDGEVSFVLVTVEMVASAVAYFVTRLSLVVEDNGGLTQKYVIFRKKFVMIIIFKL